jgi:DNA-directed RNA polymerase subunit L
MDIKEILNGDAMSQSGYTIPSQLSNPKKHMVMFNLPATYGTVDEIKHVLVGALEHMRSRLNRIKASIIINQKRGLVDFKVNKTDDIYQCTLRISQETMTIGNLIRHYIYENDKTVANLSVKSGKHAEDISINIGHTIQPEALIKKAISHAVSDLEKLTSDVMKITPKHYPMEKYITDFNASAKI